LDDSKTGGESKYIIKQKKDLRQNKSALQKIYEQITGKTPPNLNVTELQNAILKLSPHIRNQTPIKPTNYSADKKSKRSISQREAYRKRAKNKSGQFMASKKRARDDAPDGKIGPAFKKTFHDIGMNTDPQEDVTKIKKDLLKERATSEALKQQVEFLKQQLAAQESKTTEPS